MPTGTRYELLDPFDPRQEPGRPPRLYPLHLMEPGDYFAFEVGGPYKAARVRAAVVNFRKSPQHKSKRFAVRHTNEFGNASLVCVRLE